MPEKTLKIAFTGSTVLTPAYPTGLADVPGPLTAIMPGARRMRASSRKDPINAQFAFIVFPYDHLVIDDEKHRDADYKYPGVRNTRTGVCFLEREHLTIDPKPKEQVLSFDKTPANGSPSVGSSGAEWIARWEDFAEGKAKLKLKAVGKDADVVRVELPAGKVSAAFVAEPIARINFGYGSHPATFPYAQTIVVTLTFKEEVSAVTLVSTGLGGKGADPSRLKLAWHGRTEMEILFGNGSLASLDNMLRNSFVGHDHEGDLDLEFEIIYDVVDCPTIGGKRPLPRIKSHEILQVPCVSSMITATEEPARISGKTNADITSAVADTDDRRKR